jgi:hypothetical protein
MLNQVATENLIKLFTLKGQVMSITYDEVRRFFVSILNLCSYIEVLLFL